MVERVKTRGFTLVELSLAMTFIGILSVIVVALIQNVTASFRRGITLNQINTVGMDLIDDFRSSIQNSSSSDIKRLCEIQYTKASTREACVGDNAMSFVSLTRTANVKVNGKSYSDMPVFGVLCTGTYTYIWNSGYLFVGADEGNVELSSSAQKAKVKINGSNKTGFRLLRIYDNERNICINAAAAYNGKGSDSYATRKEINESGKLTNAFELSKGIDDDNKDQVVELLTNDKNSNLVLYDLYVSNPAVSAEQGNLFYSGSMILGTTGGGINIRVAGNNCKPPNDTSKYENFLYCSINKFNFAMEAGGK